MTKEERDKREAEKKAHLEGSPGVGEFALPINRKKLRLTFIVLAGGYFLQQLFLPHTNDFLLWFYGIALTVVCLLPAWLWLEDKIHGLPLWPVYCLNFIPSYVSPVLGGSAALQMYTPDEQLRAVLTLAGFVALGTLVVHQITCRIMPPTTPIRAFDLEKVRWMLLGFVLIGVFFMFMQQYLWQLGVGALSAVRGILLSLSNLGVFGLAFLWGQRKISTGILWAFLAALAILMARQAAGFILAPAIATAVLAFVSFVLGRQKIPWGAAAAGVAVLFTLHAGKYQMRTDYWKDGIQGTNEVSLLALPEMYAEWFANGLFSLGKGETRAGDKVVSATERGVMIHLLMMVQQKTPSQVPYLKGETYQYLPSMLIPRIFSKEKVISHVGNLILSVRYGLLDEDTMLKTSIGFDPVIEGYANFGYWGVAITAILLGAVVGTVTYFGCGVPILSYRFLLAVLVLSGLFASNNTVGVMLTTIWQSFLALTVVALVMMKKLPNPLWMRMQWASFQQDRRTRGVRRNSPEPAPTPAPLAVEPAEVPSRLAPEHSPSPERHARPERFIYGKTKK